MSSNPFENQPDIKENDFIDAVKAFALSVGFFMGIGVIAIIVEVILMNTK